LCERLSDTCSGKYFTKRVLTNSAILSPRRFFRNLDQKIIESGYTPPWILTREERLNFWKSITNEEEFAGNRPADYAAKSMGIVDFLHDFWTPWVGPENRILELGCNVGANLNGLFAKGYRNLSGMEINKNAIEAMRRVFPELAKVARISQGSLEELLPQTPSKSVDVIFTMATLIHIHPTSNFIFPEMVRVAKKYIVVIERETANCSYVFARNYRRVFQRLGCPHSKSVMITRGAFPNVSRNYDGYTARMFSVSKS
jgi:SAM-dependent methyltransferase